MRKPLWSPLLITALALPLAADLCPAQSALSDLDLRVTEADVQPAVTLKEYGNRTVEEYSVNNNTYMLKITPRVGAPYYLVDEDGSGDMAWNRGRPELDNNVPQWALTSW